MAMIGHYPEERSENKGNEPEGIEYAKYGRDHLLFVGSERSSIVSVYKLGDRRREKPSFIQALPAGVGPEGLLALPNRNLLVVASEVDDRGDKIRSSISIYKRGYRTPTYPTIASKERRNGTPIPWAALSALAAHPRKSKVAWTVYDSFYRKSRIFKMDISDSPAIINREIVIKDTYGKFAEAIEEANGDFADAVDGIYGESFVGISAESLFNDDDTINVDPEGLAKRAGNGFWVASEGARTVGETDDGDPVPVSKLNWLFRVNNKGHIMEVVAPPLETNLKQIRFGFEGVTSVGRGAREVLYVCFQREWMGDPEDHVRIGRYEVATGEWSFFYYPIDERESPNGGRVGLSEIVAVSDYGFLVIERDNQGGLDAFIKKIYYFSIHGHTPLPEPEDLTAEPEFPVVEKELVRDLIPDLLADNGVVIEKVEGLAALADGRLAIVTDNDGVDDSSGETQFIILEEEK